MTIKLTRRDQTFGGDTVFLAFDPSADPAGTTATADPGAGGGDPSNGAGIEGTPPAPGSTPDGQPEPAPGSQPSAWDFKVKWRGQEKPLTREEALRHASMGFDYTQKNQELARQRAAFERERAEWQSRSRPPAGDNAPPTGADGDDRIARLEQQIIDDKLERSLNDLASRHGEHFDRDVFLAEVARMGGNVDWKDLDTVAENHVASMRGRYDERLKKMLADDKHPQVAAFKKAVIDEYVKGKLKPGGKSAVGTGGLAPGGSGPAKPPATEEERDALKRQYMDQL